MVELLSMILLSIFLIKASTTATVQAKPRYSIDNERNTNFCINYKGVLTYDAYTSTTAEEVEVTREVQRTHDRFETVQEKLVQIFGIVQSSGHLTKMLLNITGELPKV